MQFSRLTFFFSIISALGFITAGAGAEEKPRALQSLTNEVQDLDVLPQTPEVSAPEIPAWQPVTFETPGAREQNFWEGLSRGRSLQDCSVVALPVKYGMEADNLGGIAGSAIRRFHRYFDGTLALVDEAGLKLQLGSTDLELPNTAGISIRGGARLKGSSIVIRPLGGRKACEDLLRLVKIPDYRTVLPFKPERFAAMQNGEVWKIPLSLWTGFTSAVAGGGNISIRVSFGVESERLPSVSLFRLSERELRVRLRIEQARITSYGVSLNAAMVPVTVGLDNLAGALASRLGELVGGAAGKIISHKFEDYAYASLGLSRSNTKGKKALLEFVLDPGSREQMDTLVKLLRDGQLTAVAALARTAGGWNFLPGHNNTDDESELEKMQIAWNEKLGIQPSYSGQNRYRVSSTEFKMNVPLLTNYSRASGRNYQAVHTPGSSETLHIHENFKKRTLGLVRIPFMGTRLRHNKEKTVTVYNNEAGGEMDAPVMTYRQLEGTKRYNEASVRKILESANSIMRYVGTQGEGNNSPAAIPLDAFRPGQAATHITDPATGKEMPAAGGAYKIVFMAFTLLFNENAVESIISAPAAMIVKAFANSLENGSGELMRKVSIPDAGTDGETGYGRRDLERVINAGIKAVGDKENNLMNRTSSFCRTAAQLATDLVRIRAAGDQKARAEMLAKVIAGGGKSGLAYGKMLKVLVQLVDPKDVAAEITYQARKKASAETYFSAQYSYNHDNNPAFANVDRAKNTLTRFDKPGQLSD